MTLNRDTLIFQILDWDQFHVIDDDGSEIYNIRLFGRTNDDLTVYLQVTGFYPYFFVEIDLEMKEGHILNLLNKVREKVYPQNYVDGLKSWRIVKRHRFWGFTNYSKFNFLQLIFTSHTAMRAYERVFKYKKFFVTGFATKAPIEFKIYESNILPILRFMHIRQLEAVGWVSIPMDKIIDISYIKPTTCQLNFKTRWENVTKYDDRMIGKFVIASFDIECTSEDGSFPQPERDGDHVIQIGITFSRFGEDECFKRHLIAFKETGPIENATVEWYNDEKKVLLAFVRVLEETNPDIITGYNIFGFDFDYLKRRSQKLGVEKAFSALSRIKNELCEWIDTKLASSALGENLFKYYKMTGRVLIDLMKVVQRDHKLSSYKLDNVASCFIRESIISIESNKNKTFKIITKNTFGLYLNQFITITYHDGAIEDKYADGTKYKIVGLGDNFIVAEGEVDQSEFMKAGYKVYWCSAKDDVGPNDIFRMFEGTPEERAIIGKYCIRDCELCNKLITKLQIVTNNVSMANVCNVPLSFLFLRGQGVKIQSLVAKKCREENHLIPVIKKNKKQTEERKKDEENDVRIEKFINQLNKKTNNNSYDDDSDDEVTFEGAIVFEPKPQVYYEPVPVLDFASLYPNSMIFRNLSHECFVDDSAYDNLQGYRYHTIKYNNSDGTSVTCKFAEKMDGSKGIIPRTLLDLLQARKKCKYEMENEKDPFKRSIWDSLQLAYKVVANSVYGQTGSRVGPIGMMQIAACTTATGREMLTFSKYFIENIFGYLINLALDDFDKYFEEIKRFFDVYVSDVKISDDNTIHIHTDENVKIPDNKFIRNSIGYEIETEFEKEFLSIPIFNEIEIKEKKKIELNNKIIKELFNLTPITRENFVKLFKNNKISKLFDSFKEVWKVVSINNSSELENNVINKLNELDKKLIHKFWIKFENIVDNIGYKNKDDFFEKFYLTVINLRPNYHTKPEVIYGDSVTEDTPLLLKYQDKIIIQKISSIGLRWKQYSDDKLEDDNIEYEAWTDQGWTKIRRVIKHETNKKIFGILTDSGYVEVTEDHSLLDSKNNIIKPTECYVGMELLHSFPFFDPTNFVQKTFQTYEIIADDQISAMRTYFKLRQMGYFVSIGYENELFTLKYATQTFGTTNKIRKIIQLENRKRWVYDLETENHHFHAGVGEILVHNTDSVFFIPHIIDDETGKKLDDIGCLEMCIKLGIWASILICTMLPPPMEQQYEKVLWPFMIQGKKMYVGNLYEKNPKKFSQKSMGLVTKRRDNSPIVKIASAGIINQILNMRSSEGACEFIKKVLHDIITGKYKIDKFIITKTLKGNALTKAEQRIENMKPKDKRAYADRTRIVHAVLADRMAERDVGNRPLSNDRIPYVYVEVDKPPLLQGDRVETPEYIEKNNLKIDYLFYITNQIMKPCLKFLDLIVENAQETIFDSYIFREENRKKSMMPLSFYTDNDSNDEIDEFQIDQDFDTLKTYESNKDKKIKRKQNNHKKPQIKYNLANNFSDMLDDNFKCIIEEDKLDETKTNEKKLLNDKSKKKSKKTKQVSDDETKIVNDLSDLLNLF